MRADVRKKEPQLPFTVQPCSVMMLGAATKCPLYALDLTRRSMLQCSKKRPNGGPVCDDGAKLCARTVRGLSKRSAARSLLLVPRVPSMVSQPAQKIPLFLLPPLAYLDNCFLAINLAYTILYIGDAEYQRWYSNNTDTMA